MILFNNQHKILIITTFYFQKSVFSQNECTENTHQCYEGQICEQTTCSYTCREPACVCENGTPVAFENCASGVLLDSNETYTYGLQNYPFEHLPYLAQDMDIEFDLYVNDDLTGDYYSNANILNVGGSIWMVIQAGGSIEGQWAGEPTGSFENVFIYHTDETDTSRVREPVRQNTLYRIKMRGLNEKLEVYFNGILQSSTDYTNWDPDIKGNVPLGPCNDTLSAIQDPVTNHFLGRPVFRCQIPIGPTSNGKWINEPGSGWTYYPDQPNLFPGTVSNYRITELNSLCIKSCMEDGANECESCDYGYELTGPDANGRYNCTDCNECQNECGLTYNCDAGYYCNNIGGGYECLPGDDCQMNPTYKMCAVWGDPHYTGFDRQSKTIDFMGENEYIITQKCEDDRCAENKFLKYPDMPWFRISGGNTDQPWVQAHYGIHVTFLKFVRLQFQINETSEFVEIVRNVLDSDLCTIQIGVNGNPEPCITNYYYPEARIRTFGSNVKKIFYDVDEKDGLNPSGSGLNFEFGEHFLKINLACSYYGKVCGMCGNANGIRGDDWVVWGDTMTTIIEPAGRTMPPAQDVWEAAWIVGTSWEVPVLNNGVCQPRETNPVCNSPDYVVNGTCIPYLDYQGNLNYFNQNNNRRNRNNFIFEDRSNICTNDTPPVIPPPRIIDDPPLCIDGQNVTHMCGNLNQPPFTNCGNNLAEEIRGCEFDLCLFGQDLWENYMCDLVEKWVSGCAVVGQTITSNWRNTSLTWLNDTNPSFKCEPVCDKEDMVYELDNNFNIPTFADCENYVYNSSVTDTAEFCRCPNNLPIQDMQGNCTDTCGNKTCTATGGVDPETRILNCVCTDDACAPNPCLNGGSCLMDADTCNFNCTGRI